MVAVGGGYYWFKAQVPQEEPASVERMAYPLPDKPSIAVLPFSNLSDDKQQEYFADGMTEDLITDISKVSGLFVIGAGSMIPLRIVSVTCPPASAAPANSNTAAMRIAVLTVIAPEPTDVPMTLATSLAPIPQVMYNPNMTAIPINSVPCC